MKKPTLAECFDSVKGLTSDLINVSEEELNSRARLLYLMNRLPSLEDLSVLVNEINYQKNKS